MYAENSVIENCMITNNISGLYGGGLYHEEGVVINSIISHNFSESHGGGVSLHDNAAAVGCLVSNNSSDSLGGGIYAHTSTIVNSTIVRNSSLGEGAGVYYGNNYVYICNLIVWGNEKNGVVNNLNEGINSPVNMFNAIEIESEYGNHIVLNDLNPPLFVNPSLTSGKTDTTTNVDWHLQEGSPCINRGTNDCISLFLDLDGNVRVKHDTVDLGCYESDYYSVPIQHCTTFNVTDEKIICANELPIIWNGVSFTEAGTQMVTLQTVDGCDSVVTMTLTVSNIYQTTDEKTVCQTALPYEWNGVTFNAAGTQEVTLQAANGCDSVVAMTLTVNPIYQVTDTKTICESELPYDWNGITFNAAGTQEVTLQATNGCDSVVTMTLTVNPIYQVTDAKTICESELPYTWNNVVFNAAGTQNVTLQAVNGCDSVVAMTLTVNPIYQMTDTKTICESELPYTWNNVVFNAAGTQNVTLQTVSGCDSVVAMTLTVNPIYQVTDTKTICKSELPYTWNNVVFNAAGTQNVTLQAVNGCDSVVAMTLTVNPIYQVTDTKTICESELPYTWNNVVFNAAGTQNVTLQTVNGCDSVVAMTLTVNPIYQVTDTKTICESELPYTWNNVVFNAAGTQNVTLQAVNGCDSVVAMTLTVNPIYQVTDTKAICESELPYTWNNVVFSAAGTQNVTLQTVNGCDSVVAMTLTVNPIYQVTDAKTICESELPYTWNNVVFNAAGTQSVTLQAVTGCDSVVAMTLTVNPIYQVTDTKTICESELPYTWNNVVFNAAGTQNVTLQTVNGCDSVVAMTLTVNPIYQVADTQTICESELPYTWNNVVFNAAGTQNVTLQTVNGCDSVVAMTLTVNPIYQVTDTKTICESELPYTWNNVVFNAAGTQNVTMQTVNGCDSVVAMTLTVNPIYQVTDTKAICESELPYTWNNVVFNAAGTQNVTLQTINGCDSVVAMTLTVNPIYQVTDAKTICESELPYTWNNVVFNAAGTQNVTLQTINGCDSVVAMTLTVNPTYQVADSKTICQSELPYTWNNVVFNAAGTQNVTLQTVNGCDSVVAMTLIVNPTYTVNDIRNVCPSELPYTWNGITFNAAGAQTVTLQTVNGCDSVVTMILAVNQTHITNESRTICESELPYEWNGITFNSFGANTAILQDENGCDSTIIMTLNVIPSYRITDTRTICQSELPYTWNNIIFNAADTQSVTLQATNSCDSVVTMILIVNPTYSITETKSVCPSEMPYTWNGVTFNNAGVQTVTLQTVNGCDSVVTMMLTVNQTHVTNESRTICENELPYEWNGVTFNAAGMNTATLPDANGCDSTVIMTLIVNPAYAINETMSICESELPYTWNGVVFNTAGTQTLNLETVNGCDSIITMTLTVNPTYAVNEAQTICESELPYTWNGFVFNAAGTQSVTLQTIHGCDSVVTMTLTVNMPVSTDLQVTACESYDWNEDSYTESGNYTQTFTAANGCDSVVTLHLTINNGVSTEFTIETSENCYTWNEETYCQSGDYVQTFTAANGCDSVVTLHLTTSVGINSFNLNVSMTVYPNPTSDVINVEFGMDNEQWQPDVLQLFDASGKTVNSVKLSNTYNGSTRTTQIDLSNLSNGIYFLKATKEGQTMAIRKIVKN